MKFKHTVNLLLALSCLSVTAEQGQLYDNTNYKAIYFKEACDLIANTPGLLLLDVRSPGEYADTSQFIGSRIGRLKGAINISIDSILLHYRDLVPYKNRTILVYCSHSQRSRGVSRLLGDSGFTKVYSLNGGMTEVDREPDASFPCKASLYTSNLPYRLMGPEDAAVFIKDKNNVIIDIRPATQFNGTDTAEMTNIGRIKGAINIPGTELDQSIAGLEKYKDRPILLYDLYTSNAMKAAARLTAAGFKKVAVLFNGFDTFLLNFSSASPIRKEWIMAAPRYQLTGVREAVHLVNHSPDLVVADMRAIDQFENKSKQKFFNLGHIRNAVNFQNAQQLEDYLKGKPKNTPVLIYGAFGPAMSSMNTDPVVDLPALSRRLAGEGYTRIHLLYAGIYSLVWASANVDGQQDAKGILIDHEGLY